MKKVPKQPKLQDLFEESANLTELALTNMAKAVNLSCNDKDSEESVKQTIQTEKKQDRVREKIIERLFGRETMVFSRSDRLKIIYALDRIVDKAESIVRKLNMHKPKTNDNIQKGIGWMGEQAAQVGSLIRETIIIIFSDFSKATPLIKNISDIRREVRTKEYELLNLLFKSNLEHTDFTYFHDIINSLTSIVNVVEEFSDELFEMICKYTLG